MSRLESLKIKAKLLQKAKVKAGKPIQLKHAYEIIAKSAGYDSWREMKQVVEQFSLGGKKSVAFPYWNNWYSSYDEAKSHLKGESEYLIPFEKHFFICGQDYIEALGISIDDDDLKLVGHDWANPADREAFDRLLLRFNFADN